MEALVVVEEADWNMLSIQGNQDMRNIPSMAEDRFDLQPVLWECGVPHHLPSIGPDDSVTDLRHKVVDGGTRHPGSILQGGVAVSSGQMSEGDCQLYSWTHRISHPGPVPLELSSASLLQLLKELRQHPAEVSVCHRVI